MKFNLKIVCTAVVCMFCLYGSAQHGAPSFDVVSAISGKTIKIQKEYYVLGLDTVPIKTVVYSKKGEVEAISFSPKQSNMSSKRKRLENGVVNIDIQIQEKHFVFEEKTITKDTTLFFVNRELIAMRTFQYLHNLTVRKDTIYPTRIDFNLLEVKGCDGVHETDFISEMPVCNQVDSTFIGKNIEARKKYRYDDAIGYVHWSTSSKIFTRKGELEYEKRQSNLVETYLIEVIWDKKKFPYLILTSECAFEYKHFVKDELKYLVKPKDNSGNFNYIVCFEYW